MKKNTTLSRLLIHILIAVVCLSTLLFNPLPVRAAETTIGFPKLSEIYPNAPGSSELGSEFIELFNYTASTLDLATYTLQIKDKPSKSMALSGQLPAYSYKAFITTFSLINSGEVVQLLREGEVIEEVSYGGSAQEDQSWSYFLEGWELTSVTKDEPNQHLQPEEPLPIDMCPATPEFDSMLPNGYVINEDGVCVAEIVQVQECLVDISEISAQPIMNGQEYIEFINNSGKVVTLKSCKIRINSSAERQLPEATLQPWQRYAHGVTSGTIKNTGGFVTLIKSNNQEFQYTYPPTDANQSVNFAVDSLSGVVTNSPTPGQENEESSFVGGGVGGVSVLADCGPGKYRSLETNRCRAIEAEAELAPCASDQERNPATNRCRKISPASASLTPCDPGQERNPETNRCRKVGSESEELKPCETGYERNPTTNRCRKSATAVSGTPLAGAANPAAINASKYKIPVIAAVLTIALGYALYEYRLDIKNKYHQLREHFRSSGPLG